jgi:DnaD/phage-associated family protein
MARKRYITSAMCGDDKVAEVAELDPLAALAWPWIITNLDDWGRMGANPREVRLNVFQAFPTFTAATIDQILTTLHGAGLAHLYEVDGRRFLQVNPTAYYKLQTYIDKTGPKVKDSSKLPPPLGHPWSDYWPSSIWRVAESSGNRQSPQEVAETATSLQKPAETGGNCTLSFSSTLTSTTNDDDDSARAVETEEPGGASDSDPSQKPDALAYVNQFAPNWHLTGLAWEDLLDYGESPGWPLVVEAVKRTAAAGSKHINYCLKILKGWQEEGITSVQQVLAADVARQADQKRRDRGAPGGRGQPERKSNVLLKGPPKSPEYYAHVYKKFEDGPPTPSGEDPPKGDGRESA